MIPKPDILNSQRGHRNRRLGDVEGRENAGASHPSAMGGQGAAGLSHATETLNPTSQTYPTWSAIDIISVA